MNIQSLLLPLSAAFLAGCVTVSSRPATDPPTEMPMVCDAGELQGLIGSQATEALGANAIRISGARTLRWIPPRTAVTKDYRRDRLNIYYDDSQRITQINCG